MTAQAQRETAEPAARERPATPATNAADKPATSGAAKTPVKKTLKIPVWVETEAGHYWQEGQRQSFKIQLDEKDAPVRALQNAASGTVILLIFDTVADLAGTEEAKRALATLLGELPDNYWIGVFRSLDGLRVLQEPTGDRKAALEKIQTVDVGGRAGLLDTLEPVTDLGMAMLQRAGVRIAALYVTDSLISQYRADYLNPVINASDAGDLSRRFSDRAVQERMSQLAESLSSRTIPLFVLHFERRSDALNLAYQSGLERIATDSGGQAIFCRTTDEIRPSLSSLLDRLRAQYLLSVEATDTRRPFVKVKVEAVDKQGAAPGRVSYASQVVLGKNGGKKGKP
ncbi:MAG: hypothetical protein ACKV2V_21420 [Blastocatellia bacterium]